MTDVTPIPANDDTTQASPTWGEAGGPFTVPAKVANGYGAETLPANDVNFNWQHNARWIRAMRDRTMRTDLGFMAECLLRSGDWNVGGGTLDAYLDAPAYIVLDPGDKGLAVIREFNVPLGDPITLTATRDNYVAVGLTGLAEVNAVIVDAAAPVPSAGFTNVWRLRTSATEITQASPGLLTQPQLRSFGVVGSINATAGVNASEVNAAFGAFTSLEASNIDTATITGHTVNGPLVNFTHAVTSDWRDAYRPSQRTFTGSAITPGAGSIVLSTDLTGVSGSGVFPRSAAGGTVSAVVGFDLDITLVVGASGSGTVPVLPGSLHTVYHKRFQLIATLTSTTYEAVTLGTGTGVVDGTEPVVAAVIADGNVRINITIAAPINAPLRFGITATQYRIAVEAV